MVCEEAECDIVVSEERVFSGNAATVLGRLAVLSLS
jgi:hypothetical protein